MSQENVEVVKELVAASQLTRMPRGAVGVGREAVWDFYRQWFETWDRPRDHAGAVHRRR